MCFIFGYYRILMTINGISVRSRDLPRRNKLRFFIFAVIVTHFRADKSHIPFKVCPISDAEVEEFNLIKVDNFDCVFTLT